MKRGGMELQNLDGGSFKDEKPIIPLQVRCPILKVAFSLAFGSNNPG